MAADDVQFDVDDTSPTISYSPFRDSLDTPNLLEGWNPYYTDSGFSPAPGETGKGTSLHITSRNNAQLSITWRGTGLELQGNLTNARVIVQVDGAIYQAKSIPLNPNTFFQVKGLPHDTHVLTLTTQTGEGNAKSMVVFDKAIIIAPPPPNSNATSFQLSNLDDNKMNMTARWSFDESQRTYISRTPNDIAWAAFLGTSFLIHGTTSPDAANYSITLDGVTAAYSARSSFVQPDSLLFYASGLDPNMIHNVEIKNDGGTLILPVGGLQSFASGDPNPPPLPPPPPPLPPPSTIHGAGYSTGTIAALALAGILAFFLISGLFFFFLVYRPRRARMAKLRRERREARRKGREAGLDLPPDPELATSSNRRHSGISNGFWRWKRDAEGGGLGLSGIAFRRSESEKEKYGTMPLDTGSQSPSIEEVPRSIGSLTFSSSPKPKLRNWLGIRKQPSSTSFTIDLPQAGVPHSVTPQSLDASSNINSLSYLSTPSPSSNNSLPPITYRENRLSHTPPQTQARKNNVLPPSPPDDRGSVREFDDGLSVLGPATALAAIRGLSPRTSEAGSPSPPMSDEEQASIAQAVPGWRSQSRVIHERRKSDTQPDERGIFVDVAQKGPAASTSTQPPRGSALIASGQPRPERLSSQSHVRFENVESDDSKPDKGKGKEIPGEQKDNPKSTFRLTPLVSPQSSRITSFIDFGNGSSDASLRTHSNETTNTSEDSVRRKSRWSATTPSVTTSQHGQDESSSASASTSQSPNSLVVFPFPVSLPASPHHPEGFRPSPPPSDNGGGPSSPLYGHPSDLLSDGRYPNSPAGSLPVSINDMRFARSDSEADSSSDHRHPGHPPLPSHPQQEEEVSTPSYVVQRVLGYSHSRSASGPSGSPLTPKQSGYPPPS